MTDQPDQDLPTAGRRPPPASSTSPAAGDSLAPGDEPTEVRPSAGSPSAGTPGARGPEEAAVEYVRPAPGAALAPPADAARGTDAGPDEETARLGSVTASVDDLEGPTRRLDSPERVTRETDAPGVPEESAGVPEGTVAVPEGTVVPEESLAVPEEDAEGAAAPQPRMAPWRRLSSAGALIWVLLALFGFTLVVQLRSNDGDQGLATARQEDLVRILSDLEARDSRLQSEISALETSQRQLTSGVAGRQAALTEAEKRADELGLLAGTLPGRGPGLVITMEKVKASAILNAVQELRGAGGEVMQIAGTNGQTVRIVASSYFVDAEGGGIIADGAPLTGPYVVSVIGSPQTMQTALQIPGGVVASVNSGGGSVTMEQRPTVEVTAVRRQTTLQYARPVS